MDNSRRKQSATFLHFTFALPCPPIPYHQSRLLSNFGLPMSLSIDHEFKENKNVICLIS
jgi:hypothetical protein